MSRTMSSEEEAEFIRDMDKSGYQGFNWAVRPQHFPKDLQVTTHLLEDTQDPTGILKLSDSDKIDHIRNNGSMQNFNCDSCGNSMGKGIIHADNELFFIIYYPGEGFTFTDGKRQDYCSKCAQETPVSRVGIFDRQLITDI